MKTLDELRASTEVCEHGSQERKCTICESLAQDVEIERLGKRVAELEGERDAALKQAGISQTLLIGNEEATASLSAKLQAQLARANGELSDEKFMHQRAHAALLRLNMELGADALGEEVGESILEDCNADREKWTRASVDRFGPTGHLSADRATKPRTLLIDAEDER